MDSAYYQIIKSIMIYTSLVYQLFHFFLKYKPLNHQTLLIQTFHQTFLLQCNNNAQTLLIFPFIIIFIIIKLLYE